MLFLLSLSVILWMEASALDVTVTTEPSGPSYKAGSLISVTCYASNGVQPYTYQWSLGCSYTNIFGDFFTYIPTIASLTVTSKVCRNVFRCRVIDSNFATAVSQVAIETITDIAIQILVGANSFVVTSNISILTANESGRFLDIICTTGLKQPNLGKWIHPNGTEITSSDEKYVIERAGGITSLPYSTLALKDGYSANSYDLGLYTCKMPDKDMVQRESHIWILQEKEFKPAEPKYFYASSGAMVVKLHCAYSTTPGEIVWSHSITDDTLFESSQQLLQTSPVLYEGVFEIKDRFNGLIYCTSYSTVIGNHADPFPDHQTHSARHYFFMRFIGQAQSISCTLNAQVTKIVIFSNNEVQASANDTSIQYTIDSVTDMTHNQLYSCIGTVPGSDDIYANFTIIALIPNYALTMHVVVALEIVQAGKSNQLDLSAIKASGFAFDQTITCIDDSNGVSISQIDGFMYPDSPTVTGLTLHYEVTIANVKTSHAGLYICTAFLETSPMLDNISDNTNFTIRVMLPTPAVVLNNSIAQRGESLKVGSIAVFNCSIVVDTSFLDTPIQPTIKWMIGGTLITSSDNRFLISETTSESILNNTTYHSTLQIIPLLKDDEATIVCSAHITNEDFNEYINNSATIQSSLSVSIQGPQVLGTQSIQLQLIGLNIGCLEWMLIPDSNGYLETIADVIVDVLTERCNCQYTKYQITNQHFECSVDVAHAVTYRSTIYSTDQLEAIDLAQYLQEWVTMNSHLVLINQSNAMLTVNSNCEVFVESFNDSHCSDVAIETSTSSLSTSPNTATVLSRTATSSNIMKKSTNSIQRDHSSVIPPVMRNTVSHKTTAVYIRSRDHSSVIPPVMRNTVSHKTTAVYIRSSVSTTTQTTMRSNQLLPNSEGTMSNRPLSNSGGSNQMHAVPILGTISGVLIFLLIGIGLIAALIYIMRKHKTKKQHTINAVNRTTMEIQSCSNDYYDQWWQGNQQTRKLPKIPYYQNHEFEKSEFKLQSKVTTFTDTKSDDGSEGMYMDMGGGVAEEIDGNKMEGQHTYECIEKYQ